MISSEQSNWVEKLTPILLLPCSYPPFPLPAHSLPSALLSSPYPPQETGRYPAYKEMVSEYCWLDRRK